MTPCAGRQRPRRGTTGAQARDRRVHVRCGGRPDPADHHEALLLLVKPTGARQIVEVCVCTVSMGSRERHVSKF
eukprot:3559108-Prymnesium_polylepis.1